MELQQLQKIAGRHFDERYNCCQSVFHACKAFLPELADVDESLFTGFGGGFAGTGRVCGAVVAATAVVSYLKIDRSNPTNRNETYTALRKLYGDFESKYTSLNCQDIAGIDFTNPEDAKRFREEKFEQVCKPLVKYVMELVYRNWEKTL